MAAFVKICPNCGRQNPIVSKSCGNPACGASLLRVAPTVPATAPVQQPSNPAPSPSPIQQPPSAPAVSNNQSKFVKICPKCGMVCKPTANRCECGRQLFDVRPTPADEAPPRNSAPAGAEVTSPIQKNVSYMLRSEDGFLQLTLPEGEEVIVGREGLGADYLAPKGYVARRHLRVLQKDGFVTITHISKTNPTLVNNKEIESDKPYKVNDNDLIALGAQEGQPPVQYAAYFRLIRL